MKTRKYKYLLAFIIECIAIFFITITVLLIFLRDIIIFSLIRLEKIADRIHQFACKIAGEEVKRNEANFLF